ncbi:MAG: transketolase [bacterium]|nr:transketolase [bacterium]
MEINIKKFVELGKTVRKDIINMLFCAGSGHPGGSLSCVELMVALYFKYLKHHSENPEWSERDMVVFSKGHVCPTLYSCLARSGYFPTDELDTLRQSCSRLQGHPSSVSELPGVEVATGSLGQGLSIASGMAIGFKLDKKDSKAYALLGDGELQSGQIWEAVMTAAQFKLNNLCAIVDNNKIQIDGFTEDIKSVEPLASKFKSFGWHVLEVDGHKYSEIFAAYDEFLAANLDKPTVIIAETIKGKGVSFMENKAGWHGKAPNSEEKELALQEIEEKDLGV